VLVVGEGREEKVGGGRKEGKKGTGTRREELGGRKEEGGRRGQEG
jgi:hypothetical protein